mmetsp:Transcript_13488/g.22150  ORF Transcript_13488/g.22150 Transcript_13488/m.22150 type:complete len:93 (-) Transcript_13488:535-813(-)
MLTVLHVIDLIMLGERSSRNNDSLSAHYLELSTSQTSIIIKCNARKNDECHCECSTLLEASDKDRRFRDGTQAVLAPCLIKCSYFSKKLIFQ